MNSSPMAQPANGAMYWSAAGSEAEARRRRWCGPSRRFFEHANGLGDLSLLLPDRHVDADDALALLIDDRVQNEGSFTGLAVADDQFALATTDRDHRVNRLDAGLKRGIDVLAQDDAGAIRSTGRSFSV